MPLDSPRWLKDLHRFLPLKSQFVLSGNIHDLQVLDSATGATPLPLLDFLGAELGRAGYGHVVTYNPVAGFRVPFAANGQIVPEELLRRLGLTPANGAASAAIDLFALTLERISEWRDTPLALVADFSSRLAVRSDALTPAEHAAFTRALVASHRSRSRPVGPEGRPLVNAVLWVVDKEGDLPDWLVVGNPRIRQIPIPRPDHHMRRTIADSLLRALDGYRGATPQAKADAVDQFVDETEALLLLDMQAIAQLGRGEGVPFNRVSEAVRRFKVGVTEDPWAKLDRDKIRNAGRFIRERVKGQDHAVEHVLDIIKRAVTGVGAPRRGGRPRGVVFLAGPTGVGKTELAKTLTRLLFSDERAYVRFDMSEFSAEHSDQRLIGAPPGYVGYDVGGELTNAIREKPFSVVLFDEIEKAHPRIMDKFLQVLDDGVLTSGRGDRVYFSEALIVFTSNLGIYRMDPDGRRVQNVRPSDPFELVRDRVRAEIESHFKLTLNRPELLNRIGENVIVFDFIRDGVAREILDGMIRGVVDDVRAVQGIELTLSGRALAALREVCLEDLSQGGRGIRNRVEAHLLNPLARAVFDLTIRPGDRLEITDLVPGEVTSLSLSTH